MKKVLVLIVIGFLATFSACGERKTHSMREVVPISNKYTSEEKTTLEEEVLNGKIKAIYEKRISKNTSDSLAYYFDEFGLLTTKESSLFAGLNKKAIYTYNADHQRIQTTMYDYDGNQTDFIEFTYENGNLLQRFYKHAESTPKITRYFDYEIETYKYDEKGNVIEIKSVFKRKNSNTEILQRHIRYQYDSIGNRIVEERLDLSGKVTERKENNFLNKKIIESFTWQSFEDEDLYLKDQYEYYENGKIKTHIYIIYEYGSCLFEALRYTNNYFYENNYDINGRLVEETKTKFQNDSLMNQKSLKIIKFDEFGNWREKIENNIRHKRVIEYY